MKHYRLDSLLCLAFWALLLAASDDPFTLQRERMVADHIELYEQLLAR